MAQYSIEILGETRNLKGYAHTDLDYSDKVLLNQNVREEILSNRYITQDFLLIPGHGKPYTQRELIEAIVPQDLIISFLEYVHSLNP